MNQLLHVRIPEKLLVESKQIVDEVGFSNIQEFFRDCIRRTIEEHKYQKSIKKLKTLQGSVKEYRKVSKAELNKLAEALTPEKGEELIKEAGLEDVPRI